MNDLMAGFGTALGIILSCIFAMGVGVGVAVWMVLG